MHDQNDAPRQPVEGDEVERVEHFGLVIEQHGPNTLYEAGPNFDQEGLRGHLVTRGEVAAESSELIIDRLLELLRETDAIHLVGQVAMWGTSGVSGQDHSDGRFVRHAHVEYLGGLALAVEDPQGELAGPQQVQESLSLLGDLFEFERTRIMAEELTIGIDGALGDARYLLRLENLLDRTQGYVQHLEVISQRIFEPISADCIETIGFSPADIPTLLKAIQESVQGTFEHRTAEARTIDPAAFLEDSEQEKAYLLLSWIIFGLPNPAGDFSARGLSNATGIAESQVAAFLEAFASDWGSQPEFRDPGEENMFRRRPVLRAHDGNYSIFLPWLILSEIVPWFKAEIESRGLDDLRSAFLTYRADGVEALVVESVSRVFGADKVYANVEYPIGGGDWAELDVLVVLGSHAVVLEAKSNALHDAYRRGDTERIGYHVADLLRTPFGQANRAARYLLDGGTVLRHRTNGQAFDLSSIETVDRVAVSLERIDPLVLLGDQLLDGDPDRVWLVCLPDLLATAEILDSPETLAAYIAVRTRLAAEPGARVFGEMDLLGAFLEDRLASFISTVSDDASATALLGHHAGEINIYFGDRSAGLDPQKPSVVIADEDRQALGALYENDIAAWHAKALEIVLQT